MVTLIRVLEILSLTDVDLGVGQAERYARLVDYDRERHYSISPLAEFDAAYSRVSSALGLLNDGAPGEVRDVRDLAREIVIVEDGGVLLNVLKRRG